MNLPARRWLPVPLLAMGTVVVLAGSVAATAYAGTSSGSVLASTRAAVARQTGTHVVFTAHSTSSATTSEKIVADVGISTGTETIFEGTADVAVRVTSTFAYVSGNNAGLTTLFGLSAANAKTVGNKWESWKAGTAQYSNLKSDVTMNSVKALLPKAKGTSLSSETSHGVKLYLLKWTTASTASVPRLSNTLTIAASGTPLPMTVTASASDGAQIKTAISKWGEAVAIQAPPAASTIDSSKVTG